jgi:peptide deformylase
MIRPVLTYPDPRLRRNSRDVQNFDEELGALLDDMYDTMMAKGGIGLAAIQIGRDLNALIINLSSDDDTQKRKDLVEFINPQITSLEGSCLFQEGCLSVPTVYEDVERASKITVRWQDRHGKSHEATYEGLMAVAVQHEIDHLRGHLFIEKLSYLKRKKFEKEWKKSHKK